MVARIFASAFAVRDRFNTGWSREYSQPSGTGTLKAGRLDIRRSPEYSREVARIFVDNRPPCRPVVDKGGAHDCRRALLPEAMAEAQTATCSWTETSVRVIGGAVRC